MDARCFTCVLFNKEIYFFVDDWQYINTVHFDFMKNIKTKRVNGFCSQVLLSS